MTFRIPFNKPHIFGTEITYLTQAAMGGHGSSCGAFTQRVEQLLQTCFGIGRAFLTTSGTAALEMAALLCDLGPGDEVILPSFTFTSTANAIVLRGAIPVFIDIRPDTLNIDENLVEAAITPRTRAIFVVHYAGQACAMDAIMAIAEKHGLIVVEDAAQGVFSQCRDGWLGAMGHLGCYSFHETKNISCGEGGALLVNDLRFVDRAEIIRDKGTNRRQFQQGIVDKYTWVDAGSSYGLSDMLAGYLLGQLERMEQVTARRKEIYQRYKMRLQPLADAGLVRLPITTAYSEGNYHICHILTAGVEERASLIAYLRKYGILAVFHYVPLHSAPFARRLQAAGQPLPVTDNVSGRLLRLPLYYDLTDAQVDDVASHILEFFGLKGLQS